MPTFVLRNGKMVDKDTGQPMLSESERNGRPSKPLIMGFKAYSCPITGKEIRTLEQHNENLKKHGCIEYNEVAKPMNGEIKNKAWAAKRGLEVSERYRDERGSK